MSLAILNALFLDPQVSGGPETYLRGLVPELARRHPRTTFVLVTTRSGAASVRRDGWEQFLEVVALPCEDGQRLRRTVAEQVLLPRLARRRRADIVHSLASVAPIHAGATAVITLHDATFMRRRTFGRVTTFGMGQVMSRAASRAAGLISGSTAARDDVCELLAIDPGRFTVIPHGPGRAAVRSITTVGEVRSRHSLGGGRVVLCVSAKRPHKNQEILIRALPQLDEDVVLVLAGHAEPYEEALRALASQEHVLDRVRFLSYVPNDELEHLYELASCFAFPTRGEGFGLPVLEAMRRGVPVACSSIAVLREVADDAAAYFDCDDPAEAAAAIRRALDDDAMIERGRRRAGQFSWAAAADRTFEVYEGVVEPGG